MSVTIENGQIASIESVSTGDEARFYNRAESTIFGEILSAQDTDVDTVSGATFTSEGIIGAVADALSQALKD